MRKIALLIVAAVGLTATSRARAAGTPPPCSVLPDEPAAGPIAKLYIENGDTQEPMIKKMAKLLIASTTGPVRLIYRNRPTCNIRVDLYTAALMTTAVDGTTAAPTPRPIKYQPVDGSDPVACTVADPGTGTVDSAGNPPVPIQLGIGATYLSSCSDVIPSPDPTVDQFPGPVQAYGFITHNANTQNGITAEEGYLAYGFTDAAGGATPWIVQNLRFKRSNTASTSLVMAAAIHMKTTDMKAAPALVPEAPPERMTVVEGSTNPEATLGILGMDLRDANRSLFKMLPFRSFGQRFAYYPDKTKDTFDKQNVRDGHYLPWAPTPYIAKKDGTGAIADPLAKRFYDLVLLNRVDPDVDSLGAVAQSGLVPQCAMKVNRASDGADLALYTDAHPCHCAFEAKVPSAPASTCTACSATTPCGTGTCRFGYCEAH